MKKTKCLSPDQGAHAYQPRPLISSSGCTHVPSHHHHCSQHDHRLWRAFLTNFSLWGEWWSWCQVITGSPAQTWQDCSPSAPVSHPQMQKECAECSETRSTRAATISWKVLLTKFADNVEQGCWCQLITESRAKTWHQPTTRATIPRLAQLAASSTSDPSKASRGESSAVGVERCCWPRPCASPTSGKSRCNSSSLSLRAVEP